MKHLYSVLRVTDKIGDCTHTCVVVCETQQDEKDVIRNAEHAGMTVTNIVPAEEGIICLNDFC